MHRKSLTGEAKLNRDKAMLNDYIAGMHIAELAEKYGIGCTNVKKSLEVLEGFDAVRRNDRKSPNRKPNNQKRLSKADMEQRNIEIAQDYKNGAWTFEIAGTVHKQHKHTPWAEKGGCYDLIVPATVIQGKTSVDPVVRTR